MKILHIIVAGYRAGGAESILIDLKSETIKRGHEVKILSSDLRPELPHYSDYEFKSVEDNSISKMLLYGFNPFSFFKLKQILKEYRPDIVHLHTMNHVSPSVLFLLKNYTVVQTIHGHEVFLNSLLLWHLPPSDFTHSERSYRNLTLKGKLHYLYLNYVIRSIYKIGLKNVDLFIAPSKFMMGLIRNEVKPVIQMYNPIKLFKYLEIVNSSKLLFVGRLEEVKGIQYLIEAMPQILKKYPSTILDIVGDGTDKARLTKFVYDLKLTKSIKFHTWVDKNDLEEFYRNSSIVVVPSIWPENLGMVCIEAMSVGRPVIGTRTGGIPELIDDEVSGLLVEPGNSAQIVTAVDKLFSNCELLQVMGRNAVKNAELFSIEKYIIKLENVYKELIIKTL